ncbi:hypothetical protein NM208_g14592 [Fusarium decemcellulare]|uniref:Uncharacterized protein n=1 Tax=Fusarium decemcellulare TaxID=57161 RepID=A0ACC1RIV4_9HYPO|nr:hypothetical protein NM208_g14592 [Fusarium decemcellulare]
MDTATTFSPLWTEESIVMKPESDLALLHAKILQLVLNEVPLPQTKYQKLCVEDTLRVVTWTMMQLLSDLGNDNAILNKIRGTAAVLAPGENPFVVVQASISMWYLEAAVMIYRQHQGRRDAPEKWRLGRLILPWKQGYSVEFPVANLGLMALLAVADAWQKPVHPKLQAACLITHTTVAFLYVAYAIRPHLDEFPWRDLPPYVDFQRAKALLLKVSLSVAGQGYEKTQRPEPPAVEFGVTRGDVRISHKGSKLLIKVARLPGWHSVPYWHPYAKVPGSPWNNYIKNHQQPTFCSGPGPHSRRIEYKLPSTALSITDYFSGMYADARTDIDLEDTTGRRHISELESIRQFRRLEELSGRKYAEKNPNEMTSIDNDDTTLQHLFYTPAIQKPRADMGGYLTLPFMTTMCQAFESQSDPDENLDDFFLMTFRKRIR